jgi:hypothetical protein
MTIFYIKSYMICVKLKTLFITYNSKTLRKMCHCERSEAICQVYSDAFCLTKRGLHINSTIFCILEKKTRLKLGRLLRCARNDTFAWCFRFVDYNRQLVSVF